MSSRSQHLMAVEAGLGTGDVLLLGQSISTWKRRAKWASVGIAVMMLVCASILIGYELGILLFTMLHN